MDSESVQLKDGRAVELRYAHAGDAELFRDYLTKLGESTEHMLTHPGDMGMVDAYARSLQRLDSKGFYSLHAIDPKNNNDKSSFC